MIKSIVLIFLAGVLFAACGKTKSNKEYDLKSPCVSAAKGPCDVRSYPVGNLMFFS